MKDFSVPVDLDAKIKIDLMVVGSVAVSEKGDRLHSTVIIPVQFNFGNLNTLQICHIYTSASVNV